MARFVAILTGLLFGSLLTGPAAANTIATFSLSAFFFTPSGHEDKAADGTFSLANGTFSLDLTSHTVASASITTTDGAQLLGTSYTGFPADTYTPTSVPTGSAIKVIFHSSASAVPPISGQIFTLIFGPTDLSDVASLPVFAGEGDESFYFFLCGGLCATRSVDAFIQTVSVTSTPIPATLPLLATALGGIGIMGWRRKRRAH